MAQFLIQLPAWFKEEIRFSDADRTDHQAVREFTKMAGPATLTTSVLQLTVYVDSAFAFGLGTGAGTAVAYSTRVVQLPLGILNTAVLIPMFPRFAAAAAAQDHQALQADLHRCLRFLWFVTLPIVAIFAALSEPIVSLLLQGDQFDKGSVQIVTLALLFLVPQMFFYLGRELLARIFWSLRDTQTPFRIALFVLVSKAILDLIFVSMLRMGVAGISLATTVVSGMSFFASTILLSKQMPLDLHKLLIPLLQMFAATARAWLAASNINSWALSMMGQNKLGLFIAVSGSVLTGSAAYLVACWILQVKELKFVLDLISQAVQRVCRRNSI